MTETLWFDPEAIPTPVLTFGEQTVWTLTYLGRVCGLSAIHRVRDVGELGCVALCGEGMPGPSRHIPVACLNLPVCQRCENLWAAVTVGVA